MTTHPLRGLRVLAGLIPPAPAHRADRPVDAPTLADHRAVTQDHRVVTRGRSQECPACSQVTTGGRAYQGRHL